jgi:hypothetical protein
MPKTAAKRKLPRNVMAAFIIFNHPGKVDI